MASKYNGLRGRIPEQPSERSLALKEAIAKHQDDDLETLTALFNAGSTLSDELGEQKKAVDLRIDALEILIRERLTASNLDAASVNGYTWSHKPEPYPVAEDPAAIVRYFITHGLADQLTLKPSELVVRLKDFVKNEALNNELVIGTRIVFDADSGEEKEVPDVRSQIPGVRVFLKPGLSRVKSKGAKHE